MRTPRPGDRIRITGIMADDPAPLPIGATGTVAGTGPGQIHVDWDNGRTLILLDTDPYEIISAAPPNDDSDTHRAAPTTSPSRQARCAAVNVSITANTSEPLSAAAAW